MAQPLEYEQAGYNGPDGLQVGRTATDLISFYGSTPVARGSLNGTVTASTYTTTTNTTAVFGFNSADAVSSVVHNLSSVIQSLKTLGLLA